MPEKLKRFYIVKEHPIRIITKCKSHSKGTLGQYLIGLCILYAVMNWVPQLLAQFIPVTDVDFFLKYTDADPELLRQVPGVPIVVFLYMMMFSGVFRLSECLYALTYIRNRQIDYRALTEGMGLYFKALGIFVLRTLIVSFWTLFFVIPGIMAAINFSQAFYILADDPEKSVTEVLTESKMMMYGNRMNYVRLLICYVPYLLIAYTVTLLVADFASAAELGKTAILICSMAANIPMFLANGYMSMGKTVFYELMLNKGFAEFRYAGQQAFRELESEQQ